MARYLFNIQDDKPAAKENSDQHAGGVAPNGAGSPLKENVKKEVEEEVAKVVKHAVEVQQEEQLHNIAKQNHQEMLESLDGQKQSDQGAFPADANREVVVQPNIQPIQVVQQQQAQGVDSFNNNQQGAQVNSMQQQAVKKLSNTADHNVVGQQSNNVGMQPQIIGQQVQGVLPPGQQAQAQVVANNVHNSIKQPVDTEALKYVQQQGFLSNQQVQQMNERQAVAPQKVDKQKQAINPAQAQPGLEQAAQNAGVVNANNPLEQGRKKEQQHPNVQRNKQDNVIPQNVQNKLEGGLNIPVRNKQ